MSSRAKHVSEIHLKEWGRSSEGVEKWAGCADVLIGSRGRNKLLLYNVGEAWM